MKLAAVVGLFTASILLFFFMQLCLHGRELTRPEIGQEDVATAPLLKILKPDITCFSVRVLVKESGVEEQARFFQNCTCHSSQKRQSPIEKRV